MKPEEITSGTTPEALSPEEQQQRLEAELREVRERKRLHTIHCAANAQRQASLLTAKSAQIESIFQTVQAAGEISPDKITLVDQLIGEIIAHADILFNEEHTGFCERNEIPDRSEQQNEQLQAANARIAELEKQVAIPDEELANLRAKNVQLQEGIDAAKVDAQRAVFQLAAVQAEVDRLKAAAPVVEALGDVVGGAPATGN